MRKLILAAVFAVASMTAGATMAQDKAQELTPAQQAEYAATVQTARNLVSYGEAKGDALALVTAAKMIAGVPGRVLAEGQTGAEGADKAVNFDIEGVLKKAEELAAGDELISKVAADVRTAAEANSKATCYWIEVCNYYSCGYYWECWY